MPGNIIYSSHFSPEEALRLANKKNIKLKMREAALNLRNAIKDTAIACLSKELTVEDSYKGETDIPDLLKTFITYLISGPDIKRNNTTSKTCRIESICQDIICAATAGRKKPGKHLQLGRVMKSLTESRKIIEILNHLGHCVSYNLVEEIETEFTYAANEKDILTPLGMNVDANASTGLAFNNYDRFVVNLTGKDNLHDTVGIAYQAVKLDGTIDNNPSTNEETIETNPSTTDFNIEMTSSSGEAVVYICLFLSKLFTILMENIVCTNNLEVEVLVVI